MIKIETNLKRLVRHFFGCYFAIPNPEVGGFLVVTYARRIQGSRLVMRIKSNRISNDNVA